MGSKEWETSRLGNFTSSEIHKLMTEDKPYSKGFMSHVYNKVGEELTGKSVFEDNGETNAMRWGNMYEQRALELFGKFKGLEYLIAQQLIVVPNTRFGSTPDGIMILGESSDETMWNVSTVEIKCFPTYYRYMPLWRCNTAQEIKAENKALYWQVLDQMDNCDCLTGYSVCYHPDFMAGDFKSIEFKKTELVKDWKLLQERKRMAVERFEEIRAEFIKAGKFDKN